MTRNRLRPVACALVLALGGAACSDSGSDDATTTTVAYKADEGVESPGAELRSELTAVLQEHVLLTSLATGAVVAAQDPAPTLAVLDTNSTALAGHLGEFYGAPAAGEFLAVWRGHIGTIMEFAAASVVNDPARITAAKDALTAFTVAVGEELNALNKQLTEDTVGEELETYVTTLLATVTAQAKKDATAFTKLKEAADHMATTAIVLTAGIIRDKGAKAIPGKVDGLGSVLRASFTARLQEHVYLTGMATGTLIAGGDPAPATEALDENSLDLSRAVSTVYGDDAGREFLKLWRQHIELFVDLAGGLAGADQARIATADKGLDGYSDAFATFLSEANPELAREDVAAELEVHVSTLRAAIEAQAAKDPTQVEKLHAAASPMPGTARLLALGIARQFPTKFG